ncbi:MAG: acylphosphatase [Actinomycetota bacterium]|nr:acylphosphatase [Actinomycetota bacterium]
MDGTDEETRAVIHVRGRVQGVGFRWWARARALELGLVGSARNLPDGRVELTAQGQREQVERLRALLEEEPSSASRPGRVEGATISWHEPRDGVTGFTAG